MSSFAEEEERDTRDNKCAASGEEEEVLGSHLVEFLEHDAPAEHIVKNGGTFVNRDSRDRTEVLKRVIQKSELADGREDHPAYNQVAERVREQLPQRVSTRDRVDR